MFFSVTTNKSGGEASIVAEIVEVEDNSSSNMKTVRIPPVITVNKSAAYALYDLTYIRVRMKLCFYCLKWVWFKVDYHHESVSNLGSGCAL